MKHLGIIFLTGFILSACFDVEEKKREVQELQEDLREINNYRGFIALPSLVKLESTLDNLTKLSLELGQYHENHAGLIPNAKSQAQFFYSIVIGLYERESKNEFNVTERKHIFSLSKSSSLFMGMWEYDTVPKVFWFTLLGGVSIPIAVFTGLVDGVQLLIGKTEPVVRHTDKLPQSRLEAAQQGLARVSGLSDISIEALKQKGRAPNLSVNLVQTIPITDYNRNLVKSLENSCFAPHAGEAAITSEKCLRIPQSLDNGIQDVWTDLFIDILGTADGEQVPYILEQKLLVAPINMPSIGPQVKVEIQATAYVPIDGVLDFIEEQSAKHVGKDYQFNLTMIR